ncbi:hypothetical protein Pdw03_6099 [Penicillium digitatum]|uniref:Uncharacterized protein n=1 Tax=Penicillium digitatum TaxID=36651 RepID=A0A7T6XW29_PENDI|nr:hypothetical protein Pdw03_6099 [Penicillium digitatum]
MHRTIDSRHANHPLFGKVAGRTTGVNPTLSSINMARRRLGAGYHQGHPHDYRTPRHQWRYPPGWWV